jgi:hypothetical protein
MHIQLEGSDKKMMRLTARLTNRTAVTAVRFFYSSLRPARGEDYFSVIPENSASIDFTVILWYANNDIQTSKM